jgi:hypothetical protein
VESEVLWGSLEHTLGSENFRLPDRRGRFDIDDDRILDIDQVVRGVSKKRLSADRPAALPRSDAKGQKVRHSVTIR